ncbi:non-ribosomal peptide synthetase [Chitinophaga pinensis]|uniref:Amino acid adenylation domain protein n=1 Tax=Chitinophaga pinensis (strain ATCC 43595 / DSM 2588 / LMG 13176 / NBRC 15968 / NCIMB 11800 / UQM 2034) TaxID=485918 RepID=A0A979G1E5_CHIPD|nr:non-ribosomal peptide synthetase [Chitinophaga pinensis]ACU58931.1 amino acid adenylation domain protein [Chitinophaga pinensis DSM 2588]
MSERQVTHERNPTPTSETRISNPLDLRSLQELIHEKALLYPDKSALRFRDHVITYHKLNNSANQFARLLADYGIRKGTIVGLAVDRSPEMLYCMLAIVKAGATYLPLDPEYPQARIEFMLQDAAAAYLITSEKYSGRFQTAAKEILMEDLLRQAPQYDVSPPDAAITMQDVVYVLYTSGSTGQPKGVQITQLGLVNFLIGMLKEPGLDQHDKVLALTTISFDISGLELYLPLLVGAEVVLTDVQTSRDTRHLMEIVRQQGITVMQATPATWRMMLESAWDDRLPLKALIGGEALSKKLAERLLEKCDSLWNMYGPTETTVWATLKKINIDDEIITVGRPIENMFAYILDNQLRRVPDGTVGEIFIGGVGVGVGYLNRPALNEERFMPDPFSPLPGARMYKTGDLGRIVNGGEIQCLGRMDHQVKIRGYRIELGEVEHALGKQTGIKDVVVLPKDERLIAYVVQENGTLPNFSAWQQALKTSLPEYMVPSNFVLLPRFPLSPNGKVDRNALEAMGQEIEKANRVYTAPRTEQEKLIAKIWEDYLYVEKVGIKDDFFELGGTSIVAMQIMARIEKETGKRLPLASLFTANTVEKLATEMELDDQSISWDLLVPVKPTGTKPPIFIVNGLDMNVLLFNNIARNMEPDQPVYGFQPRGLNGVDEPFETLEDMAAEYIAALLERDFPDGYALAGYSYGGVVAYEMSRQLQAMGKKVKMLAMFDTYAYNKGHFETGVPKYIRKIKRQFPKFLFITQSLIRHPKETLDYQQAFFVRKYNEIAVYIGLQRPPESDRAEDKINEKYEAAYRKYHMQTSDACAIDLFRVDTRLYYLDDPLYLGWKPYALKGINVHDVKGDHKTFLMPPNDKDFAILLQQLVDERMKA